MTYVVVNQRWRYQYELMNSLSQTEMVTYRNITMCIYYIYYAH